MTGRRWDMGATRRVGRVFARRAGSGPAPLDLVGSGKLDGALVDWAFYRDGRRDTKIGSYVDALTRARRDDGFVWIGLFQPNEQQLAVIGSEFGLHPLALEDATEAHQRPKLERYDDTLFAVLKTVRYVPHGTLTATSEVVETGEVMIFCGPGFVITVRHGDHGELKGLRQHLEKEPKRLAAGPGGVLHAITDHVVDSYLEVADAVQADIDVIETEMFSPRGWRNIERVYQLKREVLELKRAVAPLTGPMRALSTGRHPLIADETRNYFRDVDDHLLRVKEQVISFDELLSSILQAGLAQVQVAENEDMRRISAWVAILAVPTMIAGIYGMNFDYIPGLNSPSGYFVCLAVMGAACALLYGLFKRNRWL
ncbi:magnesium and cobalt transport protein CorA [Kribbella qitaiheensis]|uniref:Magnesium and cobalt transport protein CorA n=1 Tax=Kribbella qitaiheensis TaxID=1544730 RepID=A0A7G6WWP8_9ACTN|nr:magnesium and cobalt transport protein CorA [Kribbella qitaiheensis]QNE18413.1 magnesium and cobalt transport protein CorA [Kribbella qitaiheensis]